MAAKTRCRVAYRGTGLRQDPCVLDTLISVTCFMQGDEARPWWHYTAERKARLARGRSDGA
ncbi:helix-hairpin-helix domain-containing protein [Aquabacterium sp.]|uniref:helix-hairpin-helix domain-containing protein n=1 Tax=Aquabacterium sp. TaxID=1872578 RepID=UPI003B7414CE